MGIGPQSHLMGVHCCKPCAETVQTEEPVHSVGPVWGLNLSAAQLVRSTLKDTASPGSRASADKVLSQEAAGEAAPYQNDLEVARCLSSLSAPMRDIVQASTMDLKRGMETDELLTALATTGLYPTVDELKCTLQREKIRRPAQIQDFPQICDLVAGLPCESGPQVVPHSLRGICLRQLSSISAAFLDSGWLQAQCENFNNTHKAAIEDGRLSAMRESTTALDSFMVRRVTAPNADLRRTISAEMLVQANIDKVPMVETSYSEMVNPHVSDFFVSHEWGQSLDVAVKTLARCGADNYLWLGKDKPDNVVFWMSVFAQNPHRANKEQGARFGFQPWEMALQKCSAGLAVLYDEEANPLARAWCLYEVYRAHDLGQAVSIIAEDGIEGFEGQTLEGAGSTTSGASSAKGGWHRGGAVPAEELCDFLFRISAFDAVAPTEKDTRELQRRMLNTCLPKRSAVNSATFEEMYSALNGDYFELFNQRARAILATPLFDSALNLGKTGIDAAVRYAGAGAACGVTGMQQLMASGVNMSQPVEMCLWGSKGRASFLYIAALGGRTEEMAFFLAQGLDLEQGAVFPQVSDNFRSAWMQKSTPLCVAAALGQYGAVDLLLKMRANVNARTANGWSPLNCASIPSPSSMAIVKLLVSHGAAPDEALQNALKVAARLGNAKVVDLLLRTTVEVEHGVDAEDRSSLLHHAAAGGSVRAAIHLLKNGADVDLLDGEGKTAADIAAECGAGDLAMLLGTGERAQALRSETLGRPAGTPSDSTEATDLLETLVDSPKSFYQNICQGSQQSLFQRSGSP